MAGDGGIFTGLYWVARGKTPMEDLDEGEGGGDQGGQGGGGGGGFSPDEPPPSPSGKSYYTDEEMAEWEAQGRPDARNFQGWSSSGGGQEGAQSSWGSGGAWSR